MNFSRIFILRPVGTMLLSLAVLVAGIAAYPFLPVAALPNVDLPAVVVFASRPGADPATMANSIAAPLERRIGEIGGVSELFSTSSTGQTNVLTLFDLAGRSTDDAAREVQAAINAAQTDLPAGLPVRPTYKKFNPGDFPIMTLALSSDQLSVGQLYEAADTVLQQRLTQVEGVSRVQIDGGQTPAVRIQLDPGALRAAGISADDVRQAIVSANVLEPTGSFQGPGRAEEITINGQIDRAAAYGRVVLKTKNGAVLRLSDVAHVIDGISNVRLAAWNGDKPAILLKLYKIPGANIIATVDRVYAVLPQLQHWISPDIRITVLDDRTQTIRASTTDVKITLLITGALVLLTVFLFLRRLAATVAAAVTVPLSIAGTAAGMWAMGFSLNNYSLMAITISVGFVVDDAIVMIENIARLREQGMGRLEAALLGSRQIGFTVISITLSLIAVFIPLLFMGGLLGRILHEFAFTLTIAIVISAVVSLTLTPMVCARMVDAEPTGRLARIDASVDRFFRRVTARYMRGLDWGLRHRWLMGGVTLLTIVLTIFLYGAVPKNFVAEQDTGVLRGTTLGAASASFEEMVRLQQRVVHVLLADPAVAAVGSSVGVATGFDQSNQGSLIVSLKPMAQRHIRANDVIRRLRPKLQSIAGLQTVLFAPGDFGGGNKQGGGGEYSFDVTSDSLEQLALWESKIETRLQHEPGFLDVTSDQDSAAPQATVTIDRQAASRLHVSASAIDTALSNALAQEQISRIYTERNQYGVILETLPWLQRDPHFLDHIYVGADTGLPVPLGAVAHLSYGIVALNVVHDSQRVAGEIGFNVKPGFAMGDAVNRAKKIVAEMSPPPSVQVAFEGNAKLFLQSLATEPALIAAALLSIYIVLGVLYESLIHPITIMSTLPSAGLGALLGILVTGTDFGVLSVIGIVLLMGIVKKNAIMLVDFALDAQRERGMTPEAAIREACEERFRPIIMTTLTALCGALPLALAFGTGSELRRPMGIAIVGGLVVSQALTLYTTPVIYLALERRVRGVRRRIVHAPEVLPAAVVHPGE
jgi:multidrug efflux pump